MSTDALNWAFRQNISGPKKCVLLVVSYRHEFKPEMSLSTLSFESGLSRSTCQRAISDLVSLGLLDIRQGRKTNVYIPRIDESNGAGDGQSDDNSAGQHSQSDHSSMVRVTTDHSQSDHHREYKKNKYISASEFEPDNDVLQSAIDSGFDKTRLDIEIERFRKYFETKEPRSQAAWEQKLDRWLKRSIAAGWHKSSKPTSSSIKDDDVDIGHLNRRAASLGIPTIAAGEYHRAFESRVREAERDQQIADSHARRLGLDTRRPDENVETYCRRIDDVVVRQQFSQE